jgi:hypothetical protein
MGSAALVKLELHLWMHFFVALPWPEMTASQHGICYTYTPGMAPYESLYIY